MTPAGRRAVVLLAHGSRDPSWPAPIEAVANAMRDQDPGTLVACAYLEWTSPDLATAVQAVVLDGAREVVVVPMFLGLGRHTRQDLPQRVADVAQAHPDVAFSAQPAISEDARMVALMAQIALSTNTSGISK